MALQLSAAILIEDATHKESLFGALGTINAQGFVKEFGGPVVAGDAEGAKERLAVFEVARGGPGFQEDVYGFGQARSAEGESSFFGYLIGGGEELANEGEGVAAFDGEEGFEHLPGDGGLGVAARAFRRSSSAQSPPCISARARAASARTVGDGSVRALTM
jgi:hypothetical protein